MAIRLREKKKIGLVLSGGGIKAAAFHVGVCLALKEKGFHFAGGSKEVVRKNFPDDQPMTIRLYVGSSAGSFVSAILSAGYTMEALSHAFELGAGVTPRHHSNSFKHLRALGYRDIFSLNSRSILKSFPLTLLRSNLAQGGFEALVKERFRINGFFNTKKIERYLRDYALSHNEFNQLGVELFVVGTELNHSRKVIFGPFEHGTKDEKVRYHTIAKISEAVAASTSLPPVFAPYSLPSNTGKEFFVYDGEIRETLSTHVASDHGCDLIISSSSMQPYHYNEDIGSLHQYGIPMIINQALYQVVQQKVESHIQHKADIKAIYNAVDGYFKQANLPEEHREKVLEIIAKRVNYKPQVDYIYISPKAENHEMFFADHFSLNPKVLERIVRIGFRSAISHLRQHDL
jgi:predicted acylesterase/phospholipase RssA